MKNSSFLKWQKFYLTSATRELELAWPCENLIRMFKGGYIPNMEKNYTGKKILDIGFGSANNFLFFKQLGLKIYGTEVTKEICDSYNNKLKALNIQAELRVGTNTNIPFEDNSFDFLVSWNVIHYEKNEPDINKAINEYHRVLKPNGRLFLSTTGPENSILNNCKTLGSHLYQVMRKDTFRQGEVFFFFDHERYINHYFSGSFKNLMVARTKTTLFSECLDWYLLTGIKVTQ